MKTLVITLSLLLFTACFEEEKPTTKEEPVVSAELNTDSISPADYLEFEQQCHH